MTLIMRFSEVSDSFVIKRVVVLRKLVPLRDAILIVAKLNRLGSAQSDRSQSAITSTAPLPHAAMFPRLSELRCNPHSAPSREV